MKNPLIPSIMVGALLTFSVSADLLVYEGFDPSDPSDGLDSGRLAGATSIGFVPDSVWQSVGTQNFNASLLNEGLQMDGLASTGGAIQVHVGPSEKNALVNVYRQSGVSVTPGSTFYGSFLFQTSPAPSRYFTFFGVESGEDLPGRHEEMAGPHLVGHIDAAMLFAICPDSFARDEEIGQGRITQGISVTKEKKFESKHIEEAQHEMQPGETYLVIWRVTGAAEVDQNTAGQEVVMWVLTRDNLSAIRAAGECNDAAVDGNHLLRIVLNRNMGARLTDSDFLTVGAGMAGTKSMGESIYDELRIGTDMVSVLPAP